MGPLLLWIHLARQCLEGMNGHRCEGMVVWIGRHLWPQPHALLRGSADRQRTLLRCSLLIDPRTDADRLWAIDLCLRSPVVAMVAADAGGLALAHSRRLQLAAEAGGSSGEAAGSLALLARPARELATPSAAAARWRVQSLPSPTPRPRWRIDLVRCKGVRRCGGMDALAPLILEHDRASGSLRVPADLADRPPATQPAVAAGSRSLRRAG